MRLLYVGFRYHTNQVPIMRGWQERGDEVWFLAQYEGVSEVHDYVNFRLMKPTAFTAWRHRQIDKKYPADQAESKKIKDFIPDFWDILKTVREIRPDLVILRDHGKPNALVVLACRLLGIRKVIIYAQTPLYGKPEHVRWPWKIYRTVCFPRVVFTPVLYNLEPPTHVMPKAYPGAPRYFVPLICEESREPERVYCRDGKVRILEVGKYRDYKNHFFFVDAVAAMEHRENIQVTIIGQLSNRAEQEYYEKLKAYVEEKGLSDVIDLRGNIPYYEMEELYKQQDVLALASKLETAGMVILEAMAMGLCVVSSINCGLSGYLTENDCGYTFALDKPERMSVILDDLAAHPEKIAEAGRKSRRVVREQYGFANYFDALNVLTKKEYGYDMTKTR